MNSFPMDLDGFGLSEETGKHMREGVGSMLLERIEADASSRGIVVAYAWTTRKSMQRFLRKHDYQAFGWKDTQHIKVLEHRNLDIMEAMPVLDSA